MVKTIVRRVLVGILVSVVLIAAVSYSINGPGLMDNYEIINYQDSK